MRIARIAVIALAVYVTLSLLFGSVIGYFQPQDGGTSRLRTVDENGQQYETVLRVQKDASGQLWLLSGQWFRGWYNRALANPYVELLRDEEVAAYRAVEVKDAGTIEAVVRLRRKGESTGRWLMGRALLLFPPFKALRLDVSESDRKG
jgi:hypothetical protein